MTKTIEILVMEVGLGAAAPEEFSRHLESGLRERGYETKVTTVTSYEDYKALGDSRFKEVVVTDAMIKGGRREVEKIIHDFCANLSESDVIKRKIFEKAHREVGEVFEYVKPIKVRETARRVVDISKCYLFGLEGGEGRDGTCAAGILIAEEMKARGKKVTLYTSVASEKVHPSRSAFLDAVLKSHSYRGAYFDAILGTIPVDIWAEVSDKERTGKWKSEEIIIAKDSKTQLISCFGDAEYKRTKYVDAVEAAIKYQTE